MGLKQHSVILETSFSFYYLQLQVHLSYYIPFPLHTIFYYFYDDMIDDMVVLFQTQLRIHYQLERS